MSNKKSAIIPIRKKGKNFEILLISNKEKTKWIIPKGNIEHPLPAFLSATKEAYEEAGVIGKAHAFNFGTYKRNNMQIPTFILEVDLMLQNYEEEFKRVRKWIKLEKIHKFVEEKDLQILIQKSCNALNSRAKYFELMIENFANIHKMEIKQKSKKQIKLIAKANNKTFKLNIERSKNLLIFSLNCKLDKLKAKMNKKIMATILQENAKKNIGYWSLYYSKKNNSYKIKTSHQTDVYQLNETLFNKITIELIKNCKSITNKLNKI